MGKFGNNDRKFSSSRSGGFRMNMRPIVKHKAICSDCKQDCEVPFKPIEGKPVYCKECYPKHRKF